MINSLLTTIFKLIFGIIRLFTNIITLPFTLIFNAIFPDMSNFLSTANNFFNDYLLKGVAVGREILLNLTGFPQELITISVNVALGIFSIMGTLKLVSFIFNVWRTFKGGAS